jgi:tetratricopeptide (TPR) repeat protein
MTLTILLLYSAIVQSQRSQTTIEQISTGSCSPNVANVQGNVTINCMGVDPRALVRLNAELGRTRLQLADKIREANEWARRYKDLESQLNEARDNTELSHQAEEYLHEGELEKAAAILDRIIQEEEKGLATQEKEVEQKKQRLAADLYNHALIDELKFDSPAALSHFREAYRLRPEEVKYGRGYGKLLLDQNDFKDAEPILIATLDRAKQSEKEIPTESNLFLVVDAMNNLAVLYSDTMRLDKAEDLYKSALEIYRQQDVLDPAIDESLIAGIQTNLGVLYDDTHRPREAEAAYNGALDIYRVLEKINPQKYQPDTASVENNLATVYISTKRLSQAEKALEDALTIRRKLAEAVSDAYSADVADTLNNLGNLHCETQKFTQAEKEFIEAKGIYERLVKANQDLFRPKIAVALGNLARLYDITQRPEDAEAALQAALTIRRSLADASPAAYLPEVASTLNNLANVHMDMGRMKQAEEEIKEALKIRHSLAETNPSAYLPAVAGSLHNYGDLLSATDRTQAAVAAYAEALAIDRKLAQANPLAYQSDIADTLNNLANAYSDLQNAKDAQASYEEALQINRELAKTNPDAYNPSVAQTLTNMGNLEVRGHDFKAAEASYKEALSIRRELAKANPVVYQPKVANTLNSLGGLFMGSRHYDEAESALQEALDIYLELTEAKTGEYKRYIEIARTNLVSLYTSELDVYRPVSKTTPAVRPLMLNVLNSLARIYNDMDQHEKAEASYKEQLDICRELARTDPGTYKGPLATTLNNLSLLHFRMGMKQEASNEGAEAVEINRDRWKSAPDKAGDDLARSLIIDSLVQQEGRCVLLQEAARVAGDAKLREIAKQQVSGCPNH